MKAVSIVFGSLFFVTTVEGGQYDCLFDDLFHPEKYFEHKDCIRLYESAKDFLEFESGTGEQSESPYDTSSTSYATLKQRKYDEALQKVTSLLVREKLKAKIEKWKAKQQIAESFVRMTYYWWGGDVLSSRWNSPYRHGSIEEALQPNLKLYLHWKAILQTGNEFK